jgi:hypothetical protein
MVCCAWCHQQRSGSSLREREPQKESQSLTELAVNEACRRLPEWHTRL